MKKTVLILAVLLMTATASAVDLEIRYVEPIYNEAHCENPTILTEAECVASGAVWNTTTPLTDLDHCHLEYQTVVDQMVRTADIPATSTAGGGSVNATVVLPELKGILYYWMTCMDSSMNNSEKSPIKSKDFIAPIAPGW